MITFIVVGIMIFFHNIIHFSIYMSNLKDLVNALPIVIVFLPLIYFAMR